MPNEQTDFIFAMKQNVRVKAGGAKGVITNRTIDTPTQKNKYQVFSAAREPMVDWLLEDEIEAA